MDVREASAPSWETFLSAPVYDVLVSEHGAESQDAPAAGNHNLTLLTRSDARFPPFILWDRLCQAAGIGTFLNKYICIARRIRMTTTVKRAFTSPAVYPHD